MSRVTSFSCSCYSFFEHAFHHQMIKDSFIYSRSLNQDVHYSKSYRAFFSSIVIAAKIVSF